MIQTNKLCSVLNNQQQNLFLQLAEAGFIHLGNEQNVIKEILNIQQLPFIDKNMLDRLYLSSHQPDKILSFILNELKMNSNQELSNINKLDSLIQDTEYIFNVPSVIDVINYSELRNLKLISVVLDAYKNIYSHSLDWNKVTSRVNKVILDADILNLFRAYQSDINRNVIYRNMINSFTGIGEDENFDDVYSFLSTLAKKDQVKDIDLLPNIITSVSHLDYNFTLFSFLLSNVIEWQPEIINKVIDILNNIDEEIKIESLDNIQNVLYEILSSKDEEKISNYFQMLVSNSYSKKMKKEKK